MKIEHFLCPACKISDEANTFKVQVIDFMTDEAGDKNIVFSGYCENCLKKFDMVVPIIIREDKDITIIEGRADDN